MRIVFFGTPAFAVPSLEALLAEGAQIVGVVTQPDKPQGRSRSTLVPPPIKQLAERHALPVIQPERPIGDVFLAALRHWQPDLGVVVAYGQLLRPAVLSAPKRGLINVHASLLPRLRGAAPIPWSILRGDRETGITIMQLDEGLDSGPILHQIATPIGAAETGGALAGRLALLGAEALLETLALIQMGRITPEPQDAARATYAPKIDRGVTRVDWANDGLSVSRRIRAFDPVPGAWTTFAGRSVKLFGARPVEGTGPAGQVCSVGGPLQVAAGAGVVEISEVQPSGRPRMPAEAWSRGRGPRPGQSLA